MRRARLLVNPAVPCPMAAGLFQPTVLLPTEEMDPGDLSCVLRHELTHLKRGDLWYRLVLLAAACLHWFNPLVWLLLRQAWADLELRCDDEVLRAAPPEQRRAYSEAILACIRQGQGRAPVLTTYFRGGKGSLARRFANILTPGKKRGGALVLAATLAATALLGALVGCSVAAPAASADPAAPDVPQGYKQVFVDFAPYAKARTEIQGGEAAPRSIRCQVLDGVEGWEEQKPALRASLQLPEGWQLRPAQAGEACLAAGVNAPFNLYDQAGSLVGTLGYDTYFEGQINGDDDFYGHGYKARYYWIMSGNVSWDNAYTPVSQTETTENAVCRVSYPADASPTGLAFENDGILAWDDRLMRYAALELAAGAAAPEQLAAIAASLTLLEDVLPAPTPAADPAPVAPEGFARRSITMPAYGGWETPYNGSIYNVAPLHRDPGAARRLCVPGPRRCLGSGGCGRGLHPLGQGAHPAGRQAGGCAFVRRVRASPPPKKPPKTPGRYTARSWCPTTWAGILSTPRSAAPPRPAAPPAWRASTPPCCPPPPILPPICGKTAANRAGICGTKRAF